MSARILIVDDLVTNRIILKVKLRAACHDVLQAATGEEALQIARRDMPRLILLDMGLPDLSGIEVCRRLRADPATRDIPIILISASTQRASRLEALAAGADDFLGKPLNEGLLMARIRSLLRVSEADTELRARIEACGGFGMSEAPADFDHAPRIALIAGGGVLAQAWRSALAPHLPGRYEPMTATEALAGTVEAEIPDLYIIGADDDSPAGSLRLIADLRARISARPAGLCMVLNDPRHEIGALALDLGACDLVPMLLDPQETALRLRLQLVRQRRARALRNAVREGLAMATIDPLTGLYNRRYALAQLERIAASGTRYGVMVLDIDRFKRINDTYGHAAGDRVLETVAARLSAALRPDDMLARIGGEEFLVVLPDTDLQSARLVAERLCAQVADTPIPLPDGGGSVTVTISAGLTLAPAHREAARPGVDARPGAPRTVGSEAGHDRTTAHPDRSIRATGTAGSAASSNPPRADRRHVADARAATHGCRVPSPTAMNAEQPEPGTSAPCRLGTGNQPFPASRSQHGGEGNDIWQSPPDAARAALARADAALLSAKADGRNQIMVSSAA